MKRIRLALLLLTPMIAVGQGWEHVVIEPTRITDNIYYLKGRGGNIGVLLGDHGTLMIDDQFPQLSEKIEKTIMTLSDQPVKYVINTHYHGDHTGGNENFKNNGASIIGHQNVKERLGKTFENTVLKRTMKAKSETFWPDITFSSDSSMHLYNEEIAIIHLPNSHTDGDVLIHFKTSNVIHTGDAFVRYGYPYIDISAGGTIDGFIAAQEKILEIADGNTVIIPGHGALATVKEVKELLQMLKETRAIIVKEKDKGVALEDLIPQKPLAAFHERWNGSFINSDLFVQIIYESL